MFLPPFLLLYPFFSFYASGDGSLGDERRFQLHIFLSDPPLQRQPVHITPGLEAFLLDSQTLPPLLPLSRSPVPSSSAGAQDSGSFHRADSVFSLTSLDLFSALMEGSTVSLSGGDLHIWSGSPQWYGFFNKFHEKCSFEESVAVLYSGSAVDGQDLPDLCRQFYEKTAKEDVKPRPWAFFRNYHSV